MQANCPQCAQRIVDRRRARSPTAPFSVKCPKCQTSVKFPGKARPAPRRRRARGARRWPRRPRRGRRSPRRCAQADGPAPPRDGRAARGRRERALVALPDRAQARRDQPRPSPASATHVDTVDDAEDGGAADRAGRLRRGGHRARGRRPRARRASTSASAGSAPSARRRVFLVLVGDEFKTGDGTQAWAAMADLVVTSRDAAHGRQRHPHRHGRAQRLYQVFVDARSASRHRRWLGSTSRLLRPSRAAASSSAATRAR